MPLGRFTVKNEYGLGVKELYKDGVESEDPKAVLDGVAVAGLVGLLRQLGDLSLFAAEIFHGLQEDVASTASRSRKLVTRVEQIEASLPSLEKAILSQTSHMHFAYSPGSEWHPRIKNEQNHFICDDLPHFITDSYEECNEPPRLQLLDRFDTGGPGSCLKRYSDPTFFRRASASSEARNREKTQRERKIRKSKGSSWRHSGRFSNFVPSVTNSERVQISPPTGSSLDRTVRTDPGDQLDSFTSKISAQPDNSTTYELSDTRQTHHPSEQISDVTWDEKLEIMERMDMSYETETNGMLHQQDMKPVSTVSISHTDDLSETDQIEEVSPKDDVRGLNESNFDLYESFHQMTPVVAKDMNHVDNLSENESTTTSEGDYLHENHVKTVDAENSQVDNKSEVTSCSESDLDGHSLGTTINGKFMEPTEPSCLQETHVMPMNIESHNLGEDLPTTIIDWDMELIHKDLNGSNFDHHETFTQVKRFSEGEHSREENDLTLDTIPDSSPQVARVPLDGKLSIDDVQYMLEAIEKDKWAIEKVKAEDVGTTFTPVADLSEVRSPLELIASEKFVSGLSEINIDKAAMEARNFSVEYDDPVNNVNLLEWSYHEDIDSETDNFVDALNTIDSESESEYDSQPRVEPSVSEFKLLENAPTSQRNEVYDVCEQPDVPLFLTNFENLENVAASHLSEAAVSEERDSLPCFSNEESLECLPSLPTVSQGLDVCVNAAAETTFQPAATEMTLQPATAEMTMQPAATGMTMQSAAAGMTLQPAAAEMTTFQPATTEMIVQPAAAEMRLQPAAAEMTLQPAVEMTFQPAARVQPAAAEMTLQPAPTEMTTLQPAVCKTVESSSKYSHDDKTATVPPHFSEDFPCASSTSSDPVAFWTNATLFGLQPSKPTVTSTLNSDPMNAGNGNGYIDAAPGRTMASSVKNYIDDDNSDSNSQEARDVGSLNPLSHDVLDNNASTAHDLSKVSSNAGEDRSSLLSLLGRNLLRNGLRRSGSLDNDVKNTPNNPLPASVNEKSQVSVNSPPPSPPLELMKISFRPMDGFETSKLKLKYPEGIDNHENNMETFPSFQLVPESSKLHHDMGSDDSDDDTFCQSYPCVSDDSVGHLSGSDSEQWDSGHSSTESPSSSPLHEETQPPILGSKIGYAEMKACLNNPGLDVTPQLPPLPPLEWRASRTLMNGVEEDKRERGSDSLNNKSFHSHLSNESALVQGRVRESDTTVKQKKMGDEPKAAHDQKQNLDAADEKNVDDQGDFLRQIRSKSFNLKRTDAARAMYTPILPTSTKVTAILQKASAIRQAVGSDGEDDSWSDT